jgi:hypothetical protein
MNRSGDPRSDRPAFIVLSHADIAARAYERYVQRGRLEGFASDDWLGAEKELRASGQAAARSEEVTGTLATAKGKRRG